MESHEPQINITSYKEYLRGDVMKVDFNQVEYDNVTIQLQEYFDAGYVKLRNETSFRNLTLHHEVNFNGYYLYGSLVRCFEVALNTSSFRNVERIFLNYDGGRFLNDTRLSNLRMLVAFHYPGQFLLAIEHNSFTSGTDWRNACSIVIRDVEVIRERNSRKRICTPYNAVVSFDDLVKEKHFVSKGCTAPYSQPIKGIPKCSTKNSIARAIYDYSNVRTNYLPASCQRISRMDTDVNAWTTYLTEYGTIQIDITYPEYARIITQSKDVDIHALIGNIGGYVGLFLGIN